MLKINLRRMEVFKAVFEQGSISGAARHLNVSQPSVSRMMKDFELDLGFKLFELRKGKMRSTPEAKRLFQESEPVFAHVEHLALVAQQLKKGEGGILKIAVVEFLSWDVLPRAALRFADDYPHVRLSIEVKNTFEQMSSLLRGELDLSIGTGIEDVEPGVLQFSLGEGVFVAIVPPDSGFGEDDVVSDDVLVRNRRITAQDFGPLFSGLLRSSKTDQEASKPLIVSSPALGVRLAELDGSSIISDIFSAVGCKKISHICKLPVVWPFGITAKHLEVRPLSHIQRIFLGIFQEELALFMEEHNIYPEDHPAAQMDSK